MIFSARLRTLAQQTISYRLFWTALLAAVGPFVLLFNGCNSMNNMNKTAPPVQGTKASLAFVSNSGTGTVSVFSVSTSGQLAAVSGSPFVSGAGAEFMAFDSVHKLLFVSNRDRKSVV